ncbi:hypothetical protein KY334_02735 [Candidatus Woesearchaeota archaeon]|nr:hypothetical protein [Candidatus Woesearchaeota archaeon]
MKVYKILHKPTGLFFTPSNGSGNLSTTGKVYPKKPTLSWIGNSIRIIVKTNSEKLSKKNKLIVDHFNIGLNENFSNKCYWVDQHYNVNESDWEIVKF